MSRDSENGARTEQKARETEEMLRSVLATLPVGVVVTNAAGDIVLSNEASNRIWGGMIAPAEERWATCKGWWHETGEPIEGENWASARAISRGETSVNELIDIVTYDDKRKTIQNSAVPIRSAQGDILGAVVVNEDVTERIAAQRTLAETASRMHHLSRRLIEVQEEERRHVARELHDEFGQLLATVALHLHAARVVAGTASAPHLDECQKLLHRAGEHVRTLALRLRPVMLETAGLDAALRWMADDLRRQTGIIINVIGNLHDVPGDLSIACFRVVQEALTNVMRHSQARQVVIRLNQNDRVLELTVQDDGVGFDPPDVLRQASARGSLGLLGMKERVELCGGALEVESAPGRGTLIHAAFPQAGLTE